MEVGVERSAASSKASHVARGEAYFFHRNSRRNRFLLTFHNELNIGFQILLQDQGILPFGKPRRSRVYGEVCQRADNEEIGAKYGIIVLSYA